MSDELRAFHSSLITHHSSLRLIALRQAEHALGDDVALDFAGAGLDGVAARAQVGILPEAVIKIFELPVGAEYLLRGLLRALIHLAPVELLYGAFGAGRAGLREGGQRAVCVQSQDFQFEVGLRELLP